MKTEDAPMKDKHLLIAVDESDSSRRAVLYVADILGDSSAFSVTLPWANRAPQADFFATGAAPHSWLEGQIDASNHSLDT